MSSPMLEKNLEKMRSSRVNVNGNLWGMNSYLHRAQRLFPLSMLYNFFELHFGHVIFAIFNSVNPSWIQVLK